MTTIANNVLALFFSNVSMGVEQYDFFHITFVFLLSVPVKTPGQEKILKFSI